MIKIYINNGDGQGDVDYTSYVLTSSLSIQKSINIPTQCKFSMVGNDGGFKIPVHHAYVKIYSSLYKKYVFTGFIVTDPSISFIGLSQSVQNTNFQMYQYDLSCTSDDYMLNIKSVPFIPAFVNRTQGQIIKALTNILMPGYFNTDNVDDGDIVPYLAYDPTQSWYEYVKKFGDGSRYRYSCINKEIHYKPYGDGNLGITYDETLGEGTFDPTKFTSTPLTTPLVNDVTVLGAEEGGNNREDFFIGTGFDGAFGLKHKVYGLASSFQGSSVLLSDNWNSKNLNTQNWFAEDPAGQFDYSQGALNILSGFELPLSMSYIYANNAVELAGSLVAQHGEIVFNDSSKGIIGGFYNDSTLASSGCLAGFDVRPGPVVNATISGASGIEMSPLYQGVALTGAFIVTSQVNKTYTMFNRFSSPLPVRYQQIYRSLNGSVYGGYSTAPTVTGTITWQLTETDIFSGEFTNWLFTVTGAVIPDTAVYGLVNNQKLNLTLNSTELWTPPPASLKIGCEIGASPLGQFYLSGNVQYTGAFITPSGGNLPIEFIGQEQQFDLGSGIGNQVGEIDSGTQFDILNFYSNDLPGVGVRIRLQTWESQIAVSRMQSQASITGEAIIVGDDGVRATTVSNMNPLPRTSEDCDNAAAAFLEDRTKTYYQGTYNAAYYFFNQYSNDLEFFPTCGRYLYVNSPNRNLVRQNMLVTSVTISYQELAQEIAYYSISFGPDKYVEKVLSSILPINQSVFQAVDTAIQPTPLQLTEIGLNYLPDIIHSTVKNNVNISGSQFYLSLQDTLAAGAEYEIRSADWNWGQNDGYLIARYAYNQDILMPRTQYDQTWFIRQVVNPGTVNQQTSRRTKCIRIVYPRIPSPPVILTADTANVNLDLSGDLRNIEGLELRQSDDQTVVYRTIVGTRFDTMIDMDLLRGQLLPGQQGLTGLGKFLVTPFASGSRLLQAHFFNLMWEYSSTLSISMPPFSAPILEVGYRFGSAIAFTVTPASVDALRTDFKTTNVVLASGANFNDVFQSISVDGAPGTFTITAPVTGAVYAAAQYVDHVGSGAWSDWYTIPLANLIASDWLSSQGSVPPSVIVSASGSGTLLNYTVGYFLGLPAIQFASQAFSVVMPNGDIVTFTGAISPPFNAVADAQNQTPVTANIQQLSNYGFFISINLKGPIINAGPIQYHPSGPWRNYTTPSNANYSYPTPAYTISGNLAWIAQDGYLPLLNGAIVVQTPATGSWSGGGSTGGSFANFNCGIETSKIQTATLSAKQLKDVRIGDIVKTPNGVGRISYIEKSLEKVCTFVVASGLSGTASLSHVLKCNNHWASLADIIDLMEDENIGVWTKYSEDDKLRFIQIHRDPEVVIKLHLENVKNKSQDVEHYYLLDGFWAHNLKYSITPSAA